MRNPKNNGPNLTTRPGNQYDLTSNLQCKNKKIGPYFTTRAAYGNISILYSPEQRLSFFDNNVFQADNNCMRIFR